MDTATDIFVYILLLLQIPVEDKDLWRRAEAIGIRQDILIKRTDPDRRQIDSSWAFKGLGEMLVDATTKQYPPSSDLYDWPPEDIIKNVRSQINSLNKRYEELSFWHGAKREIYKEIIENNNKLAQFWEAISRAHWYDHSMYYRRMYLYNAKKTFGDHIYNSRQVPFQIDNFYRKSHQ